MAKEALSKMQELMTNSLNITLKKRMVKTLVWPVVLYGAETCTLGNDDRRRLDG